MTQRSALTEAEKQYLQQRKEMGISLGQIAQELQCSIETTRKWWRLLGKKKRPGLRGRPKHGILSTYPQAVREKVIAVKQAHPHWGPISIKLEMQHDPQWAQEALPSNACLSSLFQQVCPQAVQPRQHRLTRPKKNNVHAPHQRWQMDAKEGVRVGHDWVTIQEIRDVFSGVMLAALAFVTTTTKRWRRLSLSEHQRALRGAFQCWGFPLEVQTDHDGIFVVLKDPQFPSLFTLWLVGLGVTHVTSRPYRPTDQGAIERNHRTLGDFSWKDQTFDQLSLLQQALDTHRQRYNEEYPSQAAHCEGHPPLVAFPGAHSSGRPYHPAHEWDAFCMERVDAFLATFVWTRPVMPNGVVNLGSHPYYLDYKLKGQRVSIQFHPASRSFCFQSTDGVLINELPAVGLTKSDLLDLIPDHSDLPVGFQFPLPLEGV
jgi:transposase InsO family protein/transposase-like protein